MKNRYLIYSSMLLLSAQAFSLQAQVTIGSLEEPVKGALLQLKETGAFQNNATSTKGLGMPRVKLTDLHNLYPMFDADAADATKYKQGLNSYVKATEDLNHIGMMVYHTDKCSMFGKGLYVWGNTGWTKLGDQSPGGLNLSTPTLDFASGQDLRTLATNPFSVSWGPNGADIVAPTWAYQAGNYTTLDFDDFTPVSGSLTTSPQTMSVKAKAMTPTEISANPFLTKDRKVVFTFGECNNMTATMTISQTNKALRINDKSETSQQVLHKTNGDFPIKISSNAKWIMNMYPVANNSSAVVPTIEVGAVHGLERNDSQGEDLNGKYNITVGATRDRYTTLVFSDSQSSKRFKDVKINITQCSGTDDPKMEEWALKLGTAQDEIASNGVAWHRDQSNNIFLSMNYDPTNPKESNNRWMITNLSAKDFDSRTPRTGSDDTVLQGFGPSPTAASNYKIPIWAYPNTSEHVVTVGEVAPAIFENRERLGRLYNWAAATNSLGGTSNGQNIPSGALGNQDYPAHRKVQGICPNGWHLPSDYEWTQLENVIVLNTENYSATPDISSTPLNSSTTGERGKHGKAMIDTCEPTAGHGTSNSPLNGGFSVLLAGLAQPNATLLTTGATRYYAQFGFFWAASHNGTNSNTLAFFRGFATSNDSVDRRTTNRDNLFSVRCKKDN